MTTTFDLYGTSLDAARLRDEVSAALGVEFTTRDSWYKGGYLIAGDRRGEHFEIQPNQIPGDDGDELAESDFSAYPVLLYVNATRRADEVRQRLRDIPALVHLRRAVA